MPSEILAHYTERGTPSRAAVVLLRVGADRFLTHCAVCSLTQASSQCLSERQLLRNAAGCVEHPGQYGIGNAHSSGSVPGRRQQDWLSSESQASAVPGGAEAPE